MLLELHGTWRPFFRFGPVVELWSISYEQNPVNDVFQFSEERPVQKEEEQQEHEEEIEGQSNSVCVLHNKSDSPT